MASLNERLVKRGTYVSLDQDNADFGISKQQILLVTGTKHYRDDTVFTVTDGTITFDAFSEAVRIAEADKLGYRFRTNFITKSGLPCSWPLYHTQRDAIANYLKSEYPGINLVSIEMEAEHYEGEDNA